MLIQIEPSSLTTNSTISVKCFSPDHTPLPSPTFTWTKTSSTSTHILPISSPTYQCTPYDLNSSLSLTISSTTESKHVELGVVAMDYLLKEDICQMIQSSSANFLVAIGGEEYVINFREEGVEVVDTGREEEREFGYLRVEFEIVGREAVRVPREWKGVYVEGGEGRNEMRFKNRTIRDLFLFCYRGLVVKGEMVGMYVGQIMGEEGLKEGGRFDWLMEIEELKRDVGQWKRINKMFKGQKEELEREIAGLREENRMKESNIRIGTMLTAKLLALESQNTSLLQQLSRSSLKQKQMQNVIEYLQQYRDRIKLSTSTPTEGNLQQSLAKYKTRAEELKMENEFLFKEKEGLAGELRGMKVKYQRVLEMLDETGERVEQAKRENKELRERGMGMGMESVGEGKELRQKYESLKEQYQILKRGYEVLNRSRDLSFAASSLDESNVSSKFYLDKLGK